MAHRVAVYLVLILCAAAPYPTGAFSQGAVSPSGALRTSLVRPHPLRSPRLTSAPSEIPRRAHLISCSPQMVAQDRHVQVAPTFTVPEGKMGDMKALWPTFYDATKKGTDSCLYYGFTEQGNKVFCREGYKDAAGVLAHLGDVDAPLKQTMEIVGPGGLDLAIYGPQSELDKLKDALTPLGAKFFAMSEGAMWFDRETKGSKDTHVTIFPVFNVQEGKMEEFQAGFPAFYEATKGGSKECLYYGFATRGNQVFCREGYASAAGCLEHLGDVKAALGASMKLATVDLAVMGPAGELKKLEEAMPTDRWEHWVADGGSFWK